MVLGFLLGLGGFGFSSLVVSAEVAGVDGAGVVLLDADEGGGAVARDP